MTPTVGDERPYSTIGGRSLSRDDLENIAVLRKALGEELLQRTPIFNNDFSLHRWITGWDNKHDEIIPRFKRASRVIASIIDVTKLDVQDADDANRIFTNYTHHYNMFAGGAVGFDKHGDIIATTLMGRIHAKGTLKCCRVSEMVRVGILDAILGNLLIQKQEQRLGHQCRNVVIMDMDGFSRDHLFTPGIKVYMNILTLVQEMFPEVTRMAYIINAPTLFASAYAFFKPILAPRSREKIQVLGSDYRKLLFEEVGSENLYPIWGGTKKAVHGSGENGTLRLGIATPEDFKYSHLRNHDHVDDSKLTKLSVPARSKKEVKVEVTTSHRHLHWFFKTTNDVDFWICAEDDSYVTPKIRIQTEFVPEYGRAKCEPGVYTLSFDNSYSMLFSKEVKYYVQAE